MKAKPVFQNNAWPENLAFDDRHPPLEDFRAEILGGLTGERKSLAPKFFYDERGADLFLRITELPEYYLTRTEKALLPGTVREIRAAVGPGSHLIEYGSGNSGKAAMLIEGLDAPQSYLAIEISKPHLLQSCGHIAGSFPDIQVAAVCADFTATLDLSCDFPEDGGRNVAFFPGSSIGNFEPADAVGFLANARATVGRGGSFLIGVDLKKDARVLHEAYNDSIGVTAAFNLNLLRRINREAEGQFDLRAFRHSAFYDEALGRIEMHLKCIRDHYAEVAGNRIRFRRGETIHTENSYKYTVEEFRALARSAGWNPAGIWTDEAGLFSLHYLEN